MSRVLHNSLKIAEMGFAYAGRILQHRFEDRLQVTRRSLEMTRSTSAGRSLLLQCSLRSSVRWRSSLSSRVFSIAITAWAAKFWTKLDLLVRERPGRHFWSKSVPRSTRRL